MTAIFPREAEQWGEGDKAYCVSDHVPLECSAKLEKGRVYTVSVAKRPSNIGHHAIRLAGFNWAGNMDFVWSNRFVKLGPIGGRLQAIMAAIEYSPMHYWPNCHQFRNGNRHSRKRTPKATETRSAETEGPQDDGAVAKPFAQTPTGDHRKD